MTNNKTQLSEGILTSLVDNFFKSLERGVSDRYIKAAEKADLHPEVIEIKRGAPKKVTTAEPVSA